MTIRIVRIALCLAMVFAISCASRQPLATPQAGVVADNVPDNVTGYDAELTTYQYPFDVKFFAFESQKLKLRMAYMDLASEKAGAPVVVLLHGKNYSGFYFDEVAKRLHAKGYRVVMPDQIGFGKSSKPAGYQFSFQALASNTKALLENIGVTSYVLVGHSMGGMLATRMALLDSENVKKLILVNPIGLEDWRRMTSYRTVDESYQAELKATSESIRKYQSDSYFSGGWKPEYDRLIEPAAGWTKNADLTVTAWNAALTSDMVFTQPVVYEFKDLKVPTALIIGQADKTAIGRAWATEPMKSKMGNYPALGKKIVKQIPNAKLYELPGLGHVPFVEDIDTFFKNALMPALK